MEQNVINAILPILSSSTFVVLNGNGATDWQEEFLKFVLNCSMTENLNGRAFGKHLAVTSTGRLTTWLFNLAVFCPSCLQLCRHPFMSMILIDTQVVSTTDHESHQSSPQALDHIYLFHLYTSSNTSKRAIGGVQKRGVLDLSAVKTLAAPSS